MGDRWKRRENNFPFENSGGRSVLRIQVRITQMNGYAPIRDWGSHTSGASRSKARRRRHGTHGICGGCRASFGHLVVRVLGVTPRKGMRPLDGQRRPTSSHNRRRPTGCNHRHNALDAQAQASYVAGTCASVLQAASSQSFSNPESRYTGAVRALERLVLHFAPGASERSKSLPLTKFSGYWRPCSTS